MAFKYENFLLRIAIQFLCILIAEVQIFQANSVVFDIAHKQILSKNTRRIDKKVKKNTNVFNLPSHIISRKFKKQNLEYKDSSLPTNANNFKGKWNASVDSRTGSVSFSFTVGTILFNNGRNKRELILTHSSGESSADMFDLGSNWGWNVGTESTSIKEVNGKKITQINLGNGKGLAVDIANKKPIRHKLHDINLTGSYNNWIVFLATGIKEYLNNGYEVWERTKNGNGVWFYYNKSQIGSYKKRLTYICGHALTASELKENINACKDDGVKISYDNNSVTIHAQQTIVLHFIRLGNTKQIDSISMPSLSSDGIERYQRDYVRFYYDTQSNHPQLLRTISYPTGLSTTFLYNEETSKNDAKIPGLPVGINNRFLPVVTEQIISTNNKKLPDQHTWFYYGKYSRNSHNYTGYQSNRVMIPGKDNILDQYDNYTYSSTMQTNNTRTTTIYNKYQLPLSVVRYDNKNNKIIDRQLYNYPEWRNKTFALLPANYSFAMKTEKEVYDFNNVASSKLLNKINTTEKAVYDNAGQPLWKLDSFGRESYIQYCPATGDSHCPSLSVNDPWPKNTLPEKIIVFPSSNSLIKNESDIKKTVSKRVVQETIFDYKTIPNKRLFSHSKLLDAGNKLYSIEVSQKSEGVIFLNTNELKSGQNLPVLKPENIFAQTKYQYNLNFDSDNYGLLKKTIIHHQPLKAVKLNHSRVYTDTQNADFSTLNNIAISVIRSTNNLHSIRNATLILSDLTKNNIPSNKKNFPLELKGYDIKTGNKIFTELPLKNMRTEWKYDIWNRPVQKTVILEKEGINHITTWKYLVNNQKNIIIKTYPNGNQKEYKLGPEGSILEILRRDCNNEEKYCSNKQWIHLSSATYTASRHLLSSSVWHTYNDRNGKVKSNPLVTTYGYDSLDRLTWKKHPDGRIHLIVHDDVNRREISYDATINNKKKEEIFPIITVKEANITGQLKAIYTLSLSEKAIKNNLFVYSKEQQLQLTKLKHSLFAVDSLETFGSNGLFPINGEYGLLSFVSSSIKTKSYITYNFTNYDSYGRAIDNTKSNGSTTHWIWQQNRLVGKILPDGTFVNNKYDVEGNKVSSCIKPKGVHVCHTLFTRHYNSLGKLIFSKDDMGIVKKYKYDNNNRITAVIFPDANSASIYHQLTWRYNSFGISEIDLDNKPYVKYEYDNKTWKIINKIDSVYNTHYIYDSNTGILSNIVKSSAATLENKQNKNTLQDLPKLEKKITYNKYGFPSSYEDTFGNIYTTEHDFWGRKTAHYVYVKKLNKKILLSKIRYDVWSRPIELINNIGVTRIIKYNDYGLVCSTKDVFNKKLVMELNYYWNNATHNLIKIIRKQKNGIAEESFDYNSQNNNLISMSCHDILHSDNSVSLCPRETQIKNSKHKIPLIITKQNYKFDSWNNINEVREELVDEFGKLFTKITNYRYNIPQNLNKTEFLYDPHRIISINTQWSDSLYNSKPKEFSYDRLGRMIKNDAGDVMEYNNLGRLNAFVFAGTKKLMQYYYDSNSHQVAKQLFENNKPVQNPVFISYLGNQVTSLIQKDNTGKIHKNINLANKAQLEDGEIKNWLLQNYKGDVFMTINKNAKPNEINVYSPYGMTYNLLSKENLKISNNLFVWQHSSFNNQLFDSSTGFQFLGGGYRAYSPTYRHFVSRDSFSPFIKTDGYGFADNNPIIKIDNSGHMPKYVTYTLAGIGLAYSIGMSLLFPAFTGVVIAEEALDSGSGILESLAAGLNAGSKIGLGSFTVGSAGIAAGSLQIASTAMPHNTTLMKDSQIFGVLGAISGLILNGASLVMVNKHLFLDVVDSIRKAIFYASGLGSLGNVAGLTASSMGLDMVLHPEKTYNAAFVQSMNVLNIGAAALAGVSLAIISGIGVAGIYKGINNLYHDVWNDADSLNVEVSSTENINNISDSGEVDVENTRLPTDDALVENNETPQLIRSAESTSDVSDLTNFDDELFYSSENIYNQRGSRSNAASNLTIYQSCESVAENKVPSKLNKSYSDVSSVNFNEGLERKFNSASETLYDD